MPDLPYMPLECSRFFADPKVMALDGEAEAMWLKLIVHIFMNGGWIAADDHIIARALRLDIRRWKHTYKPLLVPLLSRTSEPLVGDIYRQKRVTEVRASILKLVAKNKARTAPARAEKAAKAKQRASVTEQNTASVTKTVAEPTAMSVTTVQEKEKEDKGGPPPSRLGGPALSSAQRDEASVASPGLGGRSLAQPVAPVEPEPEFSDEHRAKMLKRLGDLANTLPSEPLFRPPLERDANGVPRSRLLDRLKAKEASHDDEPEPAADSAGDRDGEDELPIPSGAPPAEPPPAGLFAALEAAIRSGGEEEDDDA